jgi:hypothetical protein
MSKEPIVLTAGDAVAAPPALIRAGLETLPAAIAAAGAHTSERFIEFFTANIRNRNTRMAYAFAVRQFFDWCEQRGVGLDAIKPTSVAAYIEQLGAGMAKPSVKQHLAAIRQLFDYLVTGGVLPSNPAGAVRGPQVRGKARQDSRAVSRPGPATVGLHRRDRTQRTPRSRPHRCHGLQLRPRERRGDTAGRGLLRERQARVAAAA